jgi:hypothetical protein
MDRELSEMLGFMEQHFYPHSQAFGRAKPTLQDAQDPAMAGSTWLAYPVEVGDSQCPLPAEASCPSICSHKETRVSWPWHAPLQAANIHIQPVSTQAPILYNESSLPSVRPVNSFPSSFIVDGSFNAALASSIFDAFAHQHPQPTLSPLLTIGPAAHCEPMQRVDSSGVATPSMQHSPTLSIQGSMLSQLEQSSHPSEEEHRQGEAKRRRRDTGAKPGECACWREGATCINALLPPGALHVWRVPLVNMTCKSGHVLPHAADIVKHSMVEKMRRERLNTLIDEVNSAECLPPHSL